MTRNNLFATLEVLRVIAFSFNKDMGVLKDTDLYKGFHRDPM